MTRTLAQIEAALLDAANRMTTAAVAEGTTTGGTMALGGLAAIEMAATELLGDDHRLTRRLRDWRIERYGPTRADVARAERDGADVGADAAERAERKGVN